MSVEAAHEVVHVEAPARLHMGFLDLNGGLGRRYGSLGLTLEGLSTQVSLRAGGRLNAQGPCADRALRCVRELACHLGVPETVEVTLHRAIPPHIGLGSGTQLSLAVGVGLTRLYGLELTPRSIARWTERGARSGIGIGAFESGGVLLDGGRGAGDDPPPVIVRMPFPDAWRVLLIFDERDEGLHGAAEMEAFRRLPPFPAEQAAHLCRLMLMQALPALAEEDFTGFAGAVGELQRRVGDHFAPAQGGRFTSARVAEVLSWLEEGGLGGVGQSSWGPTGFALVHSEQHAGSLAREAAAVFAGYGLRFEVVAGRNWGSIVETGIRQRRLGRGLHAAF